MLGLLEIVQLMLHRNVREGGGLMIWYLAFPLAGDWTQFYIYAVKGWQGFKHLVHPLGMAEDNHEHAA